MFGQYGYVDPDGSGIEHYFGAGATWTGLGRWRPRDMVGVGVAWARFRDVRGDDLRGGGEVATELFWRLQATPWLVVMPDVQWLHDPSGQRGVDDALVLTLRFEVLL